MKLLPKLKIGCDVLSANLLGKRTPLAVYLSLTDRCPTKCKYCNVPSRNQKELSTKEVCNLIDEMAELGTQRLQLLGGEPLARDDIGVIINYAKEKNIFVTLTTGGYYVRDKISEIKNTDIVFLSFDGEKEAHDYQRGAGSYDKCLEAMDTLNSNNIKFWTTTVLTKKNMHSIDFILELAEKHRTMTNFHLLYYTSLSFSEHFHPANQPNTLVMSDQEIRTTISYLIKKKEQGYPIVSSFEYLNYVLNWNNYSTMYSSKVDKNIRCWAAKLFCYIDTAGLIFPCGDSVGRVKGYDVIRLGFRNAFESMSKTPCSSCIVACDVEQNLIFSMRPRTILNWLINVG